MVTAAFTNMFAAILIFWSIFYSICKQAGYKPYEKYPTLMVLGIAVFSILGICLLPFRTAPLITLGAYQSLTGTTVDFLHFMIFVIPTLLLVFLAYLGACRFLFRVDVSALKSVKVDFIDEASLRMTKRQKAVMSFLIAFIILAVLPTILPQAFFLTQLLNAMTTTGMILLLLMIMTWVKIDGEPLISFQALARQGIIWGYDAPFYHHPAAFQSAHGRRYGHQALYGQRSAAHLQQYFSAGLHVYSAVFTHHHHQFCE